MISIELDKASVEQCTGSEWLETNGLGGWASSTISGCNTRRYHGLLVAATKPPAERMVLVSKLDEVIDTGTHLIELGTNDYGNVIHPKGYEHLKLFQKGLHPEFTYIAGDALIKKSIVMVYGSNTTIIKYELVEGPVVTLHAIPLFAGRGYHELLHETGPTPATENTDGGIRVKMNAKIPAISMQFTNGVFHAKPDWYYNFNYKVEKHRGLDYLENLYTPGILTVELERGVPLFVVLSTEEHQIQQVDILFEMEVKRRLALIRNEASAPIAQLLLAADQFIVKRNEDLRTIIAGYHWFTDWGRDTMIALPGLCLATGRFEDAKKILYAFSQAVDKGMIPNRFQDNGEAPEYNNVDGTLLYFIAVYEYLHATNDKEFVLQQLLPVLKEIVDWHFKGTRYNIRVEDDALLYAGEAGYQLTWMDARIGDWVVTPRMGKPVEVQALWFNALNIFAELLLLNGQHDDADRVKLQANKTKESFLRQFWFEEGGYLFDVIDAKGNHDASLRPNQLFAISLPFPLIEGERARQVMRIIEAKLYTPMGLRSLSPDDENYIPYYTGDPFHRDSAYHQGTVWSWLLGPYIDAIFKTHELSEAIAISTTVISRFIPHLSQAGIGSISEIFDGQSDHAPQGCIAQAWSVGEILRVCNKYGLESRSMALHPLLHTGDFVG
jgi:predicted glycogen debranching enzyme